MKIVAGLGNPGSDYVGTYHNVGFEALNVLASRFSVANFAEKHKSLIGEYNGEEKILFVKPQTFMNLSGDAIGEIARYYKAAPKDILVFYDDIDIPIGCVRARPSGSAGTHNGMRDVVNKLGSSDFARVRIGTGPKPNYMNLADYVLSHYSAEVKTVLEKAFSAAADFALDWLNGKNWIDMTVNV